jgi:hypothetical protein
LFGHPVVKNAPLSLQGSLPSSTIKIGELGGGGGADPYIVYAV